MADYVWDTSAVDRNLVRIERDVIKAAGQGVEDAMDDLIRISSQIAPIDKGVLRKSWDSEVKRTLTKIIGEVAFSAVESSAGGGRFNYALWTHEASYNLGPTSSAAAGTDGYSVGNKYLERPLYGESAKWIGWIAEEVQKAIH